MSDKWLWVTSACTCVEDRKGRRRANTKPSLSGSQQLPERKIKNSTTRMPYGGMKVNIKRQDLKDLKIPKYQKPPVVVLKNKSNLHRKPCNLTDLKYVYQNLIKSDFKRIQSKLKVSVYIITASYTCFGQVYYHNKYSS